jgi:hypothetical protein
MTNQDVARWLSEASASQVRFDQVGWPKGRLGKIGVGEIRF